MNTIHLIFEKNLIPTQACRQPWIGLFDRLLSAQFAEAKNVVIKYRLRNMFTEEGAKEVMDAIDSYQRGEIT